VILPPGSTRGGCLRRDCLSSHHSLLLSMACAPERLL